MPITGAWIVDGLLAVFIVLGAMGIWRWYKRLASSQTRLALIQSKLQETMGKSIDPLTRDDAKKIWVAYQRQKKEEVKRLSNAHSSNSKLKFGAYFQGIFSDDVCRRLTENDIERYLFIVAVENAHGEAFGTSLRYFLDGNEQLATISNY